MAKTNLVKPPRNFSLSKYDKSKSFDRSDWHRSLGIRFQVFEHRGFSAIGELYDPEFVREIQILFAKEIMLRPLSPKVLRIWIRLGIMEYRSALHYKYRGNNREANKIIVQLNCFFENWEETCKRYESGIEYQNQDPVFMNQIKEIIEHLDKVHYGIVNGSCLENCVREARLEDLVGLDDHLNIDDIRNTCNDLDQTITKRFGERRITELTHERGGEFPVYLFTNLHANDDALVESFRKEIRRLRKDLLASNPTAMKPSSANLKKLQQQRVLPIIDLLYFFKLQEITLQPRDYAKLVFGSVESNTRENVARTAKKHAERAMEKSFIESLLESPT